MFTPNSTISLSSTFIYKYFHIFNSAAQHYGGLIQQYDVPMDFNNV